MWERDDELASVHHPPIPEVVRLGGGMPFMVKLDQFGQSPPAARSGDGLTGVLGLRGDGTRDGNGDS
jgi:hypothetical protein